jgi:hypothetical protein
VSPQLRATLLFLRKLVNTPDEVTAGDARSVLDSGVSPSALEDAVAVAFAFDMIDHIADALGFDLLDEDGYRRTARILLRFGYRFPGPLRALARRNPAW